MRILDHPWKLKKAGPNTQLFLNQEAIQALGDLRFIDLPAPGAELEPGMPFITLEGSNLIDTLNAPLAGKVVKVNPDLSGWIGPQADPSAYLIEMRAEL